MKTFSIILTAAITAILFAAGCVNEEPAYKNEPGTTPAPEDGTGYLSMAGMTMRVIYDDQTDTQPDDTSSETVKPQTRAEEAQPDVDEFIVEIFDAEGTSVYKDTYANLQTETAATDGKTAQITYEQIAAVCGDDASTWGARMQFESDGAWKVYAVTVGQSK